MQPISPLDRPALPEAPEGPTCAAPPPPPAPAAVTPFDAGPACRAAGDEVEAAAAREAQARADAGAMHEAMGPALRALARDTPEPVGLLSTFIHRGTAAWARFEEAQHSEDFAALARRLPRAEALALLQAEVAQAWHRRPPGEAADIAGFLAGKLDEHLRHDATFRMRDQAVAQLRNTASAVETLAGSQEQRERFGSVLAALSEGSGEHRALARRLRESLGLEGGQGLDAGKLGERAALLREEAEGLASTGYANLPRALAAHDVGRATAEAAGIAPGSWAAQGLAAARREGEADRARYELGETVAGLAAVGAAGLLGPAGAAGLVLATGLDLAVGGIGIGQAMREVDGAIAGELAGTMPEGSADQARFALQARAATLAASMVATPVGGRALAHGVSRAAPGVAEALGHRGLHAASEVAVKALVEAAGKESIELHSSLPPKTARAPGSP